MTKTRIRTWTVGIIAALATACALPDPAPDAGTWEDRLYTPTLITRLDGLYFIVDCWHNRVLVSDTLERDVLAWDVLDDDLAGPHSIATDGELYVVEDTGRHQLRVYRRDGDALVHAQTIDDVGERPHRVRYDEATAAFYVLGSASQTISKLARDDDALALVYTVELPFLEGAYTRSFSIYDDTMYLVSGPGRIHQVAYADDSYAVLDAWDVSGELWSMNDLYRIDDTWYLTSTSESGPSGPAPDAIRTIVRTGDLAGIAAGEYEDVSEALGLPGTPYNLSRFDGRYWLPQITTYTGIISFDVDDAGDFVDIETVFDFGKPTAADKAERDRLPK